jgi:hypothetical protein
VVHRNGNPESLMAKWSNVGTINYQRLSELIFHE